MPRLLLTAALAVCFTSACAPRRIPGTEIDDTDEAREVIGVMDEYRKAVEREDVNGIVALTADDFLDNNGTGSPVDDLNRESLKKELPGRFDKVDNLKLDLTVKKIAFEESGDAVATYNYSYTFSFGPTGKAQTDTDIKQMTLRRAEGGKWKIVSGI